MSATAAMRLARATARELHAGCSDAELLRRFVADRDDAAFREILERYEALVRSASLRVTSDRHAVDNAIQATFLTLAQKAHTIRHADALPSWLYRVARRVTSRATKSKPIVQEPVDSKPSPLDQLLARELIAIFDDEFSRLPAAQQSAILLCSIEGFAVEDAAQRLGTTHGALRGWLQRGREQLRRRLSKRGVELSVVMSILLIDSTARVTAKARETILQCALAAHRPATPMTRLLGGSSISAASTVGVLLAGAISSVLFFSQSTGEPKQPPKVPAKDEPKTEIQIARDQLPEGAIARIGSPRLRHAGDIVAMAFSHDRRWLASASPDPHDKSVRVWELTDGKQKHQFPIAANQHESTIRHRSVAIAFSADDKQVMIVDYVGYHVFDLSTGKRLISMRLFNGRDANQLFEATAIIGTGFSPDRKRYAIVRRDGELSLGSTSTGEVTTTIARSMIIPENTSYSFVNVMFTPDGSEVCVPIESEAIPIFDCATGKSKRELARSLVPQYGANGNCAFVGDGSQFAAIEGPSRDAARREYSVAIGDATTGKTIRKIPMPATARVLAISPNGKLLAVSTDSALSSEVRIFELASGKELQSMPLKFTPALIEFSPDSKFVAGTSHNTGRVTIWDLENNALHPQSADDHTLAVRFESHGHVELNQFTRKITVDWRAGRIVDDKPLATRGPSRGTQSEDGKLRVELEQPKEKPGKPLAILVKEADSNRTIARLQGLTDYARTMVLVDQNRLLVTATQDDVLSVWDVGEQKLLWSEKYPARAFGFMGMGRPYFDAANRRMAIASFVDNGTTIHVWNLREKNKLAELKVPGVLLTGGIALSPDGNFVAAGSLSVTCWRVLDGRVLHTLGGHSAAESPNDRPAIRCEFSADGRKLLSVDRSGAIHIWEFATGQQIRAFTGHHGLTTASFSPDGRFIVGASCDAPILIWDLYGLRVRPAFDADRIWNDLANAKSPATAFGAVRELCASPKEAIELLKEKLKPETIDRKAVDAWIKDLSAARFAVREAASAELVKQGDSILPLIRKTLESSTEAETRQRLTAIVAQLEEQSPKKLQIERAMDALEHLGTPEGKAHLQKLAQGATWSLRTVQAIESLSRLAPGSAR